MHRHMQEDMCMQAVLYSVLQPHAFARFYIKWGIALDP